MKRNRLILLAAVIASVVFASFYGGVSYLLLFMSFSVPLISLLYLLFVYARFKINQSVEDRVIAKGEQTSYHLFVVNEDHIAYTGIKLSFYTELSELEGVENGIESGLLPDEHLEYEGTIRGRYRGSYNVGVRAVTVTDFLRLFRLTHHPADPVTVTVLPRIISLQSLALLPPEDDAKQTPLPSLFQGAQPDIESRLYHPGDSRRTINWKISARQQELMVRKYIDVPKAQVAVLIDLTRLTEKDPVSRIVIEDKLIESAIAVVHYFMRSNIPAEVLFARSAVSQLSVTGQKSFDEFYQISAEIPFQSAVPSSELIREIPLRYSRNTFCILITSSLDEEVCKAATEIYSTNSNLGLICVGDEPSSEKRSLLNDRIRYLHISTEDDIAKALESQTGGEEP